MACRLAAPCARRSPSCAAAHAGRIASLLAAAIAAVAIAGCGGGDDDGHAEHTREPVIAHDAAAGASPGPHTTAGGDGGGHGAHEPTQMDGHMRTLATSEQEGMVIEVISMEPETFTVPEGDRTIVHRPTRRDTAHLMVTLTDGLTGERIPYSSVQVELTLDGRRVLDTRLWPMISQHVGTHYGENVALPHVGRYDAHVIVGPPAVARHPELADRWTRALSARFALWWEPPR